MILQTTLRLLVGGVALALSSLSATAGEFYVDVVNGSDGNSGTSPDDAWRRITHALHTLGPPPPGVEHRVHVRPGVYSSATESFPLLVYDGINIIGDRGSAATFLDGGGEHVLVKYAEQGGAKDSIEAVLQGLTLRDALNGIYGFMFAGGSNIRLTLRDVQIMSMDGHAIYLDAGGFVADGENSAGIGLSMTDVLVSGCGKGVLAQVLNAPGTASFLEVVAVDTEVVDCDGPGLWVENGHYSDGFVSLQRCKVARNLVAGVLIASGDPTNSQVELLVEDSVLTSNGGDGLAVSGAGDGLTVRRSTIADNSGAGLVLDSVGAFGQLGSCILFGNVNDLDDPYGVVAMSHCDVGGGDQAGLFGNISEDPLFVDPLNDDYRLAFGSPCVDAGDPSAPARVVDLNAIVRPVDGDLDALERGDMGAFEHAPLFLRGVPAIGETIELELWGPMGGAARVYWARGLPVDPPLVTFFGEFDLDAATFALYGNGATAPGPPFTLSVTIPDEPRLVGRTFSFQALATSTVPAPPAAYTNPLVLTIRP